MFKVIQDIYHARLNWLCCLCLRCQKCHCYQPSIFCII